MKKITKKNLIFIIFILLFKFVSFSIITNSVGISSTKDNPTTLDRINHLKTKAAGYYRGGKKYNEIEKLFKEAVTLDPYDINLKFDLASSQIIQNKIPEALSTYNNILNIDPNNFNAHFLFAIYSKINGDTLSYSKHLKNMDQIDANKCIEYKHNIELIESIINTKLNTTVTTGFPQNNHAIVILGSALSVDGSMSQNLIQRLKIGLDIAKKDSSSKIIVSGGAPKKGMTEATAMSKWLISNGIDKDRIILEDKSMDTLENALFTIPILDKEGLKNITLITSATHMRRALTIFNVTNNFSDKMNGVNSNKIFSHLAYMDDNSLEETNQISPNELLKVYRDLIRASGIWIFPEMQR
ncbi:YdcF family protein [Bacillus toyonensis]|uniref:DUF218 domain-containing protein n=1 Tax=Bacillus toyonensis TaxID=155322 RepID=A0A2A8H7U0_9BACI|nr:YdcF family protein [Bacillus toyonensis]PEP91515.1 hypothetical protein CN585_27895 [Bacillus toyonensis]